MQRVGSVIRIPEENIAEYERLHADVWPEVLAALTRHGISNYSIFRRGELLFSYLEYLGDDLDADMRLLATDERTREWWRVCQPLQEPLGDRAEGEWWSLMTEVFHHDAARSAEPQETADSSVPLQ